MAVIWMVQQSSLEQKEMRREKGNFCPWSRKRECGPENRNSDEGGEDRREETEQPTQGLEGAWTVTVKLQ